MVGYGWRTRREAGLRVTFKGGFSAPFVDFRTGAREFFTSFTAVSPSESLMESEESLPVRDLEERICCCMPVTGIASPTQSSCIYQT